jgi:hypothetical protein
LYISAEPEDICLGIIICRYLPVTIEPDDNYRYPWIFADV